MTQIVYNYHYLATGFRNIIITLAQGIIASIRGMTIALIIRLLMMMMMMRMMVMIMMMIVVAIFIVVIQ